MLRKLQSRSTAPATLVSCEERFLNDCHQIYTDPDRGLMTIAQSVGEMLLPPKKKITVMLIGNQSTGKSSFINWYVEEQILSKTQGFTFVTRGSKRESLTSKETFRLYPHFRPIQKVKGVSKYVGTEICTSQQKSFSLVTFVDTPGLADGDKKYPFDVDQAILQLGDVCDLILVFFDPMGQALCKHTLDIVEQLNERQGDRLCFYLSKADETGRESDRQRVMMQIKQELCKRPGLGCRGEFEMPTIFIPNPNKPSQYANQIEEVCQTIEKTIKQTVQNTQNQLNKDCSLICKAIADTLNNDWQICQEKWKTRSMSCVLGLMGVSVLLICMLLLAFVYGEVMELAAGIYGFEILLLYLGPVMMVFDSVPMQAQLIACGFFIQLSIILHILAFILFLGKPTLSGKQKRQLQEKLEYLQQVVTTKKETPVLPSISPPSPPPPTTLPQSGGLPYFPPLPAPEVRSRKPDQMKFETQLKHQTLTPIPVEGTVFEELEDERLLQGTANSIMTQRDLMTKLTKKDTTPPKSTMIPKMDMMTELKRKLLKRQVSDGAIQDISKENELSTKQEMAAKEQSTLQKVPQKDLIPELKKKDTPPPKRDAITEIKKRQLKRQVTQ